MKSADCAADAAATGQKQHDRFTYTFNSATDTWTHPSIDPAIVAAALAAKAASADPASASAFTAVPAMHCAAPQRPPRQHRTLTYAFDAVSDTWAHPAMDPAAVEMAAAAAAAAPTDTMLGQAQITHDPRPLLQTRASLVSHTYTFNAAADTWSHPSPTPANMTGCPAPTPSSPAAVDASGCCPPSPVPAPAATPSPKSQPLPPPAAGTGATGKGQWSQEVAYRYSADNDCWTPTTHYTLNAENPAGADGYAYSFDAAAGKWTQKKQGATVTEAAATKLPAADTRHTYVHDQTTLDMQAREVLAALRAARAPAPATATAGGAPKAATPGAFMLMPRPSLKPARSYAYNAATGCWACPALSYVPPTLQKTAEPQEASGYMDSGFYSANCCPITRLLNTIDATLQALLKDGVDEDAYIVRSLKSHRDEVNAAFPLACQGWCDCVVCRPGYPAEREVQSVVAALTADKLQDLSSEHGCRAAGHSHANQIASIFKAVVAEDGETPEAALKTLDALLREVWLTDLRTLLDAAVDGGEANIRTVRFLQSTCEEVSRTLRSATGPDKAAAKFRLQAPPPLASRQPLQQEPLARSVLETARDVAIAAGMCRVRALADAMRAEMASSTAAAAAVATEFSLPRQCLAGIKFAAEPVAADASPATGCNGANRLAGFSFAGVAVGCAVSKPAAAAAAAQQAAFEASFTCLAPFLMRDTKPAAAATAIAKSAAPAAADINAPLPLAGIKYTAAAGDAAADRQATFEAGFAHLTSFLMRDTKAAAAAESVAAAEPSQPMPLAGIKYAAPAETTSDDAADDAAAAAPPTAFAAGLSHLLSFLTRDTKRASAAAAAAGAAAVTTPGPSAPLPLAGIKYTLAAVEEQRAADPSVAAPKVEDLVPYGVASSAPAALFTASSPAAADVAATPCVPYGVAGSTPASLFAAPAAADAAASLAPDAAAADMPDAGGEMYTAANATLTEAAAYLSAGVAKKFAAAGAAAATAGKPADAAVPTVIRPFVPLSGVNKPVATGPAAELAALLDGFTLVPPAEQAASDDGSKPACIEAAAETSDSDVALTDAEDAEPEAPACAASAASSAFLADMEAKLAAAAGSGSDNDDWVSVKEEDAAADVGDEVSDADGST